MNTEWRSLLEDVQKYILKKPLGTNLYVSEDTLAFFAKDAFVKEKKPLYSPTPVTKPNPYVPPKVQKPVERIVEQNKAPLKKAPVETIEESIIPSHPPAYDFKALKELVAHIKPGLKILEDEPSQETPLKSHSCLILGYASDDDEQEVMNNIKKAIQDTLKKSALVICLNNTPTEAECKAFFQEKNLLLSIISAELLEKIPHLKALFKNETPDAIGYLSAVPALSTKTFRGLKDSPGEKRLLWNKIKTLLG